MERMSPEQYQQEHEQLINQLPEEMRSVVSSMAWERGHSAGYEEVINILGGLVYDLSEPLKNYAARIRRDSIARASA